MPDTRGILRSAALCSMLALPLAAQEQTEAQAEGYEAAEDSDTAEAIDPSTVVVTVNGVDITIGHMIVAMQTLPNEYQQLDDQVLYDGIINQLVQQEALSQLFDQKLPARVVYSLENEKRSLVAAEVVENAMNVPLDEEEIARRYDDAYGNVEAETEYSAAHILVETEEEAAAIKAEIDGGANFTVVAQEKSIGPTGPNGGDLGWFSSGMMVPPFEAAVIALEVDEVSNPVQTQFGWHVIRLNDVRQKDIPTLEEVRPQIENKMRREIANAEIESAANDADVVVSPVDGWDASVIRRLDLLQ